jgi:hypothetical protein
MGTSLFNTTPSATYPALIKVTDNTTLNTTLKTLSDGSGNDSALQLSTQRIGVLSDSSVTTETCSVIQATTTNANLVIAPNGTGALIASIPDGTATGGNARGDNAVDLQTVRGVNTQVAGGQAVIVGGSSNTAAGTQSVAVGGQSNRANTLQSFIGGGNSNSILTAGENAIVGGTLNTNNGVYGFIGAGLQNTVSVAYGVVSGGQSNTASTGTHATVVGGQSSTAAGQYAIAGGSQNTATGNSINLGGFRNNATANFSAIIGGQDNNNAGIYAFAINRDNTVKSTAPYSLATGWGTVAYLFGQQTGGGISYTNPEGAYQYSKVMATRLATLTTGGTTVLSLDGTGTTNLIIPTGTNRMWKVKVEYVGTITTITGTATGLIVGDTVYGEENFGFKKLAGTSTMGPIMNETQSSDNAIMDTCALVVTAGASQEMALTFTGPTFAGGGSVTMRVVAKVALVEVAF